MARDLYKQSLMQAEAREAKKKKKEILKEEPVPEIKVQVLPEDTGEGNDIIEEVKKEVAQVLPKEEIPEVKEKLEEEIKKPIQEVKKTSKKTPVSKKKIIKNEENDG